MPRTLLLLCAATLLPGCFRDHFEPGRAGALEFKLSNGFWADEFTPETPLAEHGEAQLVARREGEGHALTASSKDPGIVRVLEATMVPVRAEGAATWRWLIRGAAPGKTVVEIRDGVTVVDSIEVSVAPAVSIDWQVYDPDRSNRRDDDTLRVIVKEQLEVDVHYFDASGDRLAGVRACFVTMGETKLLQDPDPSTPHACTVEVLNLGPRGPLRFTGRAFGSTEVLLATPDGGARRSILVRVGGP